MDQHAILESYSSITACFCEGVMTLPLPAPPDSRNPKYKKHSNILSSFVITKPNLWTPVEDTE